MENNNNNNNNGQQQQPQQTTTATTATTEDASINKDENLVSDKSFYKTWSLATPDQSSQQQQQDITMINNLSFVISTHIKNLITNLTKKTYKSTSSELSHLLNQYGNQGEIYLFRILIDSIDFKESKNKDAKDQLRIQLLKDEISRLSKQPNFITILCKAIEGTESLNSLEFLISFSNMVKLTAQQEILLGLALSESLERSVSLVAEKYLLLTLQNFSNTSKSLPENTLHQLLFKFKHPDYLSQLSQQQQQNQQQYQTVIKYLQSIIPPNSLALSPFLDDISSTSSTTSINTTTSNTNNGGGSGNNNSPSINSAQLQQQQGTSTPKSNPSHTAQIITKVTQMNTPQILISSLGYGSWSSASSLKEIFSQFPRITESDISQIIGVMIEYQSCNQSDQIQIPFLTYNNKDSISSSSTSPSSTAEENTVGSGTTGWDFNIFVNVVKELYPNFDWINIIKDLDYPTFQIQDQNGLSLVLSIFKKATNNEKPFPVHLILERKWTNTVAQLGFIRVAILSTEFPFHLSSKKRVDPSQLSKTSSPLVSHWNSLSLIEALLLLSTIDQDHYINARSLFDYPLKNCPDLLILGLASITLKQTNNLQNELISSLFPILLLHHSYQSYIAQLWKDFPNLVISGMADLYSKDQSSLSRILDVAQELKILRQILNYKSYPLVIDLAILASQREYLFLEKWVLERMKEEDNLTFIKGCIMSLAERIQQKSKGGNNNPNTPTTTASVAATDSSGPFSQQIPISSNILMSFHKTIQSLPGLPQEIQAMINQVNPALLADDQSERRFPVDIEEETNAYFIKLYSEQISIDQLVEILREHKNSKNQRDQDIWRCLLFNLFDEYKFLSEYPDKELRITGFLFGALIKNQLISSQPLRIALRYVLEALKYQPQSKMFIFGLNALVSFANRLSEWPQFWAQVCGIQHLKQYHPDLIVKINHIIENTQIDPKLIEQQQQQQQQQKTSPPLASQQHQDLNDNIDSSSQQQQIPVTLVPNAVGGSSVGKLPIKKSTSPTLIDPNEAIFGGSGSNPFNSTPSDVLEPDEAIKDKIHFIVNNLSLHNLDQKVKDLKDIVKSEFYEYLAHYLVMKRVIFEPNFQPLYSTFLDKLAIPDLYNKSLNYTLQGINSILGSERIREQHERGLLKNLGMWLGMNTLGKNKPLLQKLLSPKDLLIYACENNLTISIIPFVAKILDSSAQSKVFKPPNPWVMAIMKLFLEIYNLPESKNNIKFEIELLCNNLSLDITKIKPSTILHDRRLQQQQQVTTQDHDDKSNLAGGSGLSTQSSNDLLMNLPMYLQYNPSLGNLLPLFKKTVPIAFDKAIREIIAPVVERSVAIAVITSKELVSKDFATEVDEKKMKRASHLMVQNLAGSLALVTCKDPLRVSLVTYLKAIIQTQIPGLPGADQLPFDQIIPLVCNDNLDLACSIVERAATEKAILAIDEVLASSYADRLKHKERSGTQTFFDMGYLTNAVYNSLPEPLRPKPGGINTDQFGVYEDFLNLSHTTAIPISTSAIDNIESGSSPSLAAGGSSQQQQAQQAQLFQQQLLQQQLLQQQQAQQAQYQLQQAQLLQQQQAQQTSPNSSLGINASNVGGANRQFTNIEILEKFNVLLNEVDKAILRALSQTTQIELEIFYSIAQQMSQLLRLSVNQSELIIAFTQKLFARLCDNEKKPIYEIYFELLEVLRDWDPKVIPSITQLLIFCPPDKKINNVLIVGLIIHQLINVNEYDLALAKMMVDPTKSDISIDFALKLLKFCVVDNPSHANLTEFPQTFDIIQKLSQRQTNESLLKLIDDLKNSPVEEKKRRTSRINSRQEELIMDPPGLREAVIDLLQDWLLFSSTNTDQKLLIQYLSQVLQISFMKNELYFLKFFRIGLEYSLERYAHNLELQSPQYLEIDSYCKFVVLMVKHGDPTKLNILTKVLSVLIKVLTKDYETNPSGFNQRPYMRIFENLLVDLVAPDPILDHVCNHILFCFVNAFATLQPLKYPGFCFAWLDLISHKSFMPKLLSRGQKTWFHTLLIQHFRFMDPFLRNTELNEPIRLLYKGTLKVLLVLLHDFPEFLCEYHFSFCDVIPTPCIQLRNIILSAYPRNMRLPDPFTPNLKVDLLPDINQPPKISSNFTQSLKNLKIEIDNYLKNRAPYSFPGELKSKYLMFTDNDEIIAAGSRYNAPLINSLVLYIGTQAIQRKAPGNSAASTNTSQSASTDIFHRLAMDLDTDGRYLFFNAIANQLRYPNNHTHYFSCVLLYLFSESNQDIIKEQITRVLLERLISNKPHPWGLLITFIELIKNPRYNFWNHRFTKIAPEIEQIFDTLYKSCINRESVQQQQQQTQPI